MTSPTVTEQAGGQRHRRRSRAVVMTAGPGSRGGSGRSGFLRFASVAWCAGKGLSVLTVATIALSAAAPIGTVVAIGQVVAGIVAAAGGGAGSDRAVIWAVVAAGCLLLQWLTGALQRA